MAKLSRDSLKEIVKECLVEILSEGIGGTPARTLKVSKSKPKTRTAPVEKKIVENKKFNAALDRTVTSLTDDNIMRDILADTARTTLQEQARNDRGVGQPSPLANPHESPAGIDLGGIFESAGNNWASLAFAENKNSGN